MLVRPEGKSAMKRILAALFGVSVLIAAAPNVEPWAEAAKFSLGNRVQHADVYTDVIMYPGGHWLAGVNMKATPGSIIGSCVNVHYFLLDEKGIPVTYDNGKPFVRFGMAQEEKWCVDADINILGARSFERQMAGDLSPELLKKAAKIEIAFTEENKDIVTVVRAWADRVSP